MDIHALNQKIYDETLSSVERQDNFNDYWMQHIASVEVLERQYLAEMLTFAQWDTSLGNIISYLCQHQKINSSDAQWMKDQLPADSFGYKQLAAFDCVHSNLDWRSKYVYVKELKANWAISQILRAVHPEELEDARLFVASQNLGRNTKRWQLEILSQTQQKDDGSTNSS